MIVLKDEGIANGQRVPEDWHRLSANALVQRAMRGGGSAAWKLDAGEVNTRPFVLDRVHRCEAERHSPVNFVAVDYASIGDAQGAVDALNAERLARV